MDERMTTETGAERIAAERQRQIDKEGYSHRHDDEHTCGELAMAAVCYAAHAASVQVVNKHDGRDPWPWDDEWDRRTHFAPPTFEERIRLLEKSGALLAAEIDRLLRAKVAGDRGSRP